MKTNARPGFGGRARNKPVKASNPPAEAPMATIGKVARAAVLDCNFTPRRPWRFASLLFPSRFFVSRGIAYHAAQFIPAVADSIEIFDKTVNLRRYCAALWIRYRRLQNALPKFCCS